MTYQRAFWASFEPVFEGLFPRLLSQDTKHCFILADVSDNSGAKLWIIPEFRLQKKRRSEPKVKNESERDIKIEPVRKILKTGVAVSPLFTCSQSALGRIYFNHQKWNLKYMKTHFSFEMNNLGEFLRGIFIKNRDGRIWTYDILLPKQSL